MKNEKILKLIKEKQLVIPLYIFKLRSKINISFEAFIFLIYLYNKGDKWLFDITMINDELDYNTTKIMEFISVLGDAKLINIDSIRNDKGVIEEYLNLTGFYEKLSLLLITEFNDQEIESNNILETIEKEFGRTLSPIEYEIVNAWLDKGFTNELIYEALKEAIYNGVSNLRYIDKILYEWEKKGYKNKDDVNKGKTKRETKDKVEVFEYDWLNEKE